MKRSMKEDEKGDGFYACVAADRHCPMTGCEACGATARTSVGSLDP